MFNVRGHDQNDEHTLGIPRKLFLLTHESQSALQLNDDSGKGF